MDPKKRIELAGRLVAQADREFLRENREVLVSFDMSALQQSALAWVKLNAREEIAENELSVERYLLILERAFLTLFDRGAITPVSEITSLGWDALEAMRRKTGIGVASLPAAPAPELTPQQKLEVQVKEDWKKLSSAQIRQKMAGDRAYRECFERISGDLDSAATTYTVIAGA